MSERAIGYALLVVGIVVIALAAISTLLVFGGNAEPVQFIRQDVPLSLNLSVPLTSGRPTAVPVDFGELPLFKVINGAIHLLLMGFFASVGYKIAMLGVNLVRPIVVKAKTTP